jgi:hypothetical protein
MKDNTIATRKNMCIPIPTVFEALEHFSAVDIYPGGGKWPIFRVQPRLMGWQKSGGVAPENLGHKQKTE